MFYIYNTSMKTYITENMDGTCWRDCIACILEIDPGRVPDFVKRYGDMYIEKTHEWLERRFGKGLVYVPTKNFMELGEIKFNQSGGPRGYSIGYLTMVSSPDSSHAVVCRDGKITWDNGDDRHEEYDVLVGYFIIYDLEIKKLHRKKRKRKVNKDKSTKRASE